MEKAKNYTKKDLTLRLLDRAGKGVWAKGGERKGGARVSFHGGVISFRHACRSRRGLWLEYFPTKWGEVHHRVRHVSPGGGGGE